MSNALDGRESISLFVLGDRLGRLEFCRYLTELDRCLEREAPFVMIVDGSTHELEIAELPPPSWHRPRLAGLTKLHRGVAFVTGTMTHERVRSLYALQPPAVPYGFFAGADEAREWARAALDTASRAAISKRKTLSMLAP